MNKHTDMIERVKSIIDERIELRKDTFLVRYTPKFNWVYKEGERLSDGFQRVYPKEYEEVFNEIFDELHPF